MRLTRLVLAALPLAVLFSCDNDAIVVGGGPDAGSDQTPLDSGPQQEDAMVVTDASSDAEAGADADAAVETVAQVVTGRWQTCFVMSSGRLLCAGKGDLTPKPVAGITDAVEVTFGGYSDADVAKSHACIRRKGGTVACWGANDAGQLGDGTTDPRAGIVEVVGLAGVVQIAGGSGGTTTSGSTCARLSGGTVRCWGANNLGQLGNGTVVASATPVEVSTLTDAVEIASGGLGACARRAGGTAVCWGANDVGQLGAGAGPHENAGGIDFSSTPLTVSGITTVKAVSRGRRGAAALLADGTVMTWGSDSAGALGDGPTLATPCPSGQCAYTPVAVTGLVGVEQVAVGEFGSCVRLSAGGVKCWGRDVEGRLGNGDPLTNADAPVDVTGITDAVSISSGFESACAVRTGGKISCWGRNESGSLAIGSTAPVQVSSPTDVKWF